MKVSLPCKLGNADAGVEALLDDPKLLGRRPAPPPLRTRQNRNGHYACPLTCQLMRARSHIRCQSGRRGSPDAYSVIRAGTRARLCLRGKQFVLNWGPQRLAARIIDAHPRRFADPQDDSIFHPRTWHRAAGCARTLGRLSNHPTRPRRASRGNGAAAANQPRRVMKTIAFVSWQIVDDDDISAPQRWRQR